MSERRNARAYILDTDSEPLEDYLFSPERTLIAAVIERAIADALCSTKQNYDTRVASRDAYAWVLSRREDPLSFIWSCQVLNLDPIHLRNHIIKCKKEQIKHHRMRGNRMSMEHTAHKGVRIRKVA